MDNISGNNFKNKKVLVFGLGLLGGGVATTNWLIKHGALVTVTDLKDENYLEPSLKKLKGSPKLRLNGHDKNDIEDNEIIVFNPDVSINNPFVKYAQKLGRQIENEATIFYKLCPRPIIAVTGTRGKTTTANWIGYFLNRAKREAIVTGNSYAEPLLKTLDSIRSHLPNLPNLSEPFGSSNLFLNSQEFENTLELKNGIELDGGSRVVNEIPSYHLEFFDKEAPAPTVAVITNIYRDHLNRYKSFEDYARTKAKIFKNQTDRDDLILNYKNPWTKFLLKLKPKAQVWFFSTSRLPKSYNGIFVKDGFAYFQFDGESGFPYRPVFRVIEFVEHWGGHNLENLLASTLATYLADVHWGQIVRAIGRNGKKMPQAPFRQETIFDGSAKLTTRNSRLRIVNDTTATSPDGGIAAINRFTSFGGKGWWGRPGRSEVVLLITGGTDRQLDYGQWAEVVKRKLKPENVIFLSGSATAKMLDALNWTKGKQVFETLSECLEAALFRAGKYPESVILFSPAAKSFEKFKNEFDRGRQFNLLVKREVKRRQR